MLLAAVLVITDAWRDSYMQMHELAGEQGAYCPSVLQAKVDVSVCLAVFCSMLAMLAASLGNSPNPHLRVELDVAQVI